VNNVDPVTKIKTFFEAENVYFDAPGPERDIEPLLAVLDPDLVVEVPASLPHGGSWRGHAGFEELFTAVAHHWTEFAVVFDESDWHPLGDGRVMCEGRVRGILRATHRKVDTPIVSFFTFSDTGVSHLVHFYQDTAAVVASASEHHN
jgi:ketosteroid isomerase-like protein